MTEMNNILDFVQGGASEELEVDYSEQLTTAYRDKELMESLLANDGWKHLVAIITTGVEIRDRALDDPLPTLDAALKQEYVKGARQYARYVRALPSAIITSSEQVIEVTEPLVKPKVDEELSDGTET